LIGEHEHCLQRKLLLAISEEVLETGAQQIDNQHVKIAFNAKPMNIGDAN
jgi:hypothetical protein